MKRKKLDSSWKSHQTPQALNSPLFLAHHFCAVLILTFYQTLWPFERRSKKAWSQTQSGQVSCISYGNMIVLDIVTGNVD